MDFHAFASLERGALANSLEDRTRDVCLDETPRQQLDTLLLGIAHMIASQVRVGADEDVLRIRHVSQASDVDSSEGLCGIGRWFRGAVSHPCEIETALV